VLTLLEKRPEASVDDSFPGIGAAWDPDYPPCWAAIVELRGDAQ
jgi:hypothetical protein